MHVTSSAWADDRLRQGVLDLIDQGKINAVELDVKEEGGIVGWNAPVPLAHEIDAVQPRYDLADAVRTLHEKGVRVIGRLVCFNDPIYAAYAWTHGRRDEVVQTPGGDKYGGYGGFTNFSNPVVRRYQIDIAAAAAKAGVDEILYDYVRRPDGPLSSMVFPGLKGAPDDAIVSFLADTQTALKPYGTYLGASVFGVAATRPDEVAQNIPKMAEHLDYVSAMVYPSHWAPGEYGVADPNGEPYEIVQRSLEDFKKDVRGTGARVVPWLQDFSLGAHYGPAQVAAQIQAAKDDGIDEYLLWDPLVTYTGAALTAGCAHRRLFEAEDPGGAREEPEAERARPRPGADAPPDPSARERLRHDRRAAPQRADAPLAGRLLPDHRRRSRRRPDRRAEGALAGRAHLRRRDEQPGRVPPGREPRPAARGSACSRRSRRRTTTSPRPPRSTSRATPSTATAAPRRPRSRGSSSTASSSATTRRTTSR